MLTALVNNGVAIVFLYLYWQERKRNTDLSDSRVAIIEKCNSRLEKILADHHKVIDKLESYPGND